MVGGGVDGGILMLHPFRGWSDRPGLLQAQPQGDSAKESRSKHLDLSCVVTSTRDATQHMALYKRVRMQSWCLFSGVDQMYYIDLLIYLDNCQESAGCHTHGGLEGTSLLTYGPWLATHIKATAPMKTSPLSGCKSPTSRGRFSWGLKIGSQLFDFKMFVAMYCARTW